LHLILLRLDDVTIDSRTSRWWNDSSSHWVNRMHWIEWVRLIEWFIIVESSSIWKQEAFIQWYQYWSLSEKKRNSFHLLIVYWSLRSIHFEMFKLITFWSINVLKIVNVLLLIMKSIELLISCIHFIFVIFRRLYDCRKLITSIMRRFF
jgi:hypothetical protein